MKAERRQRDRGCEWPEDPWRLLSVWSGRWRSASAVARLGGPSRASAATPFLWFA